MRGKRAAKAIKKPKSFLNKTYKVNPAQVAQKALKIGLFLKKLINTESKFFDTVASTTVSTTPTIVSFNNIAQGVDYNNRVGNSIKVENMLMRQLITTDTLQQAVTFRHMIIVDNESDGALPVITDVLESSSVLSPMNHNNGKRFTVLRDDLYDINSNSINTAATNFLIQRRSDKCFKELNYHIKYDAAAGAIASVKEGNLIGIWLSSSATNATLDYNTRLRYIDN